MIPMVTLKRQETNKSKPSLQRVFVTMKTFNQLKNNLIDYQDVSATQNIQQVSIQNSTLLFQNIINDQLTVKQSPQCPCFSISEQKTRQLLFIGQVQINHLPNNKKTMKFVPHTISKFSNKQQEENSGLLGYSEQKHIYTLINSNPTINQQLSFHLNSGSRLKLGKIQIETSSQRHLLQKIMDEQSSPKNHNQQNQCRICLSADVQQTNPLLSVCLCKGSSQYIHLDCIRNQIYSKAIQVKQNVKICHISKVCCSVCEYPFPRQIQINEKKFELIDFTSSKSNMVLETKTKDKKLIFIQLEENRPITIGRNQLCDIKLIDSSISRSHAQIYLDKKQVKIIDLKSKFGTLLGLDKKVQLKKQTLLTLQSRKSIFQFKITAQDA